MRKISLSAESEVVGMDKEDFGWPNVDEEGCWSMWTEQWITQDGSSPSRPTRPPPSTR